MIAHANNGGFYSQLTLINLLRFNGLFLIDERDLMTYIQVQDIGSFLSSYPTTDNKIEKAQEGLFYIFVFSDQRK